MRIRTTLPAPTHCHECNSDNIAYYANLSAPQNPSKRMGLWVCKESGCNALASTPHDSQSPHGYMAKRDVRNLRMEAHEIFDKLWKMPSSIWCRDEAYEWIAVALEVPLEEANISRLSKENLVILIGLCEDRVATNNRIWERRWKKKCRKNLRQNISEQRRHCIEKGVRLGAQWKNPINQVKRIELRYKAHDEL